MGNKVDFKMIPFKIGDCILKNCMLVLLKTKYLIMYGSKIILEYDTTTKYTCLYLEWNQEPASVMCVDYFIAEYLTPPAYCLNSRDARVKIWDLIYAGKLDYEAKTKTFGELR